MVVAVLVVILLLKYALLYWVVFAMGLTVVPFMLYWVTANHRQHRPQGIPKRNGRFAFLETSKWAAATARLQVLPESLETPINSDSFLISEILDEFIDLITNEFINSWFVKISSNTAFQDSLKLELQNVIRNAQLRLLMINYPQLLVTKILPTLQDHFEAFTKAREAVVHVTNQNKIPTDSIEYDIEVAKAYKRGGIHYGVTVSAGVSLRTNERHYLRKRVLSFLPFLLSEPESHNDIVVTLVREIVACTVLVNVFGMLSEGDFYNLLIVKFIGDNLKHQDQVKQLRAALEEHTLSKKNGKYGLSQSASYNEIKRKLSLLTESSHVSEFKEIIALFTSITSIQELENIREYITVEFLKPGTPKENEKLSRRIMKVRNVLDERIRTLKKNKTGSLIENNINELTIFDIFDNTVVYKQFVAFMNYNGKIKYLELYNDIEKIKAPLEELSMEEEESDMEEGEKLSLSLGFSSIDDIRRMREVYFSDPPSVVDDANVRTAIDELILRNGTNDLKLYMSVRKSLFRIQNDILKTLIEDDLPKFKQSEFFQKVVDLKVFHFQDTDKSALVADNVESIKTYAYEDDDNQADGEVSQTVIKAVEDAFSQIMSSDTLVDTHPSASLAVPSSKKELLGETSSLFGDDSMGTISSPNSNRNSRLFDDLSENESGTDSESINLDSSVPSLLAIDGSGQSSENENEQLQLFLAGPGNLNLSEEIVKLNDDLHKLSEQLSILAPLIRKAELTNNVNELRILMKSRTSLEREINAKELQRQQYIVQENDNSLYGKSKVSIQSYIIANENDKDYVLYIVEVQKYSAENPNVTTAGWIVARRYSQFYKLNEYLKSNYAKVSSFKFPKKAMLVLKFQQRQIVELRKMLLEEYLQDLIKIPEVCSDRAFRAFLSSENFDLKSSLLFGKSIQSLTNKVYSGLSTRFSPEPYGVGSTTTGLGIGVPTPDDKELTDNMREMQRELRQYDDSSSNEDVKTAVFVRLICDFLISVFRLKSSKTWLRGRALVVILQQLFGTTIEKKVYLFVDLQVRSESRLLDLFAMAKSMLFPNGHFKDPPVVRTYYEMSTTKQEARVLFGAFMKEACGKIFGVVNTNYASTHLFDMVQNDFLNEHLLFEVLDIVVAEIFPEIT